MCEGYGSLCVCVCVCVIFTYMVYMSKARWHTCSTLWAFKDIILYYIVWTSLKTFCSRDMASLPSTMIGNLTLSTKNTNVSQHDYKWLSICEPLARNDDYLNWSNFLWLCWVLGLITLCRLIDRSYDHDISTWFVQLAKLQMRCVVIMYAYSEHSCGYSSSPGEAWVCISS